MIWDSHGNEGWLCKDEVHGDMLKYYSFYAAKMILYTMVHSRSDLCKTLPLKVWPVGNSIDQLWIIQDN